MLKRATALARILVTIAVMVSVVSSASFRQLAHEPADLVQVLLDHHAEVESHGHAHESIFDLIHAHHSHGHSHHLADHDHNTMFLTLRADAGFLAVEAARQPLAHFVTVHRRNYDLDRPPRV